MISMELADREKLKCYFETGAVPTETQFGELIDTTINKVDDDVNVIKSGDDIRIGIGTDSPRTKLEVAGDLLATNLYILHEEEPISIEEALDVRTLEQISLKDQLIFLDKVSEGQGGTLQIRRSAEGGIKLIGGYDKLGEGAFLDFSQHKDRFKLNQGTISMWFRYLPDSPSLDSWFRLFTVGERDGSNIEKDGFRLEVSNSVNIAPAVRVIIISGGSEVLRISSNITSENHLNGWHHVVFTIGIKPDGLGINELFLNGQPVPLNAYIAGNKTYNGPFLNASSDPNILRIGSVYASDQPRSFLGIVDEVALIDRAISEEEVQEIYQGGLDHKLEETYQNQLVSYWKMGDDHNFPTITDYSGNDHFAGLHGPLTVGQIPFRNKYDLLYTDLFENQKILNLQPWNSSGKDTYTLGNVGIGTSVPVSILHVHDNQESIVKIETESSHYSARIHLSSPETDGYLGVYGSHYSHDEINEKLVLNCWNNPVALQTMNSQLEFWTLGKERMTIANQGYVGIHEPHPKYELDINGTVAARQFLLIDENGQTRPFEGDLWQRSPSDDIISGHGNVGIGIPDPNERLAVDGAITLGISKADKPGTIRWSGQDFEGRLNDKWVSLTQGSKHTHFEEGRLGIGTNKPQALLHLVGSGSDVKKTHGGHFMIGRSSGYNLSIDDNEIAVRRNRKPANLHLQAFGGDLTIHKDKGIESEVIFKDSGRLGLGTRAPHAKLHVAGRSDIKRRDSGLLMVGDASDYHLVMDENEISVRKGKLPWHMHLQAYGGQITIHKDRPEYNQVVITENGKLGIRNNDPYYTLDINGEARKSTSNYSWIIKSDERIKKKVKDFRDGLKELVKVRPVSFEYNGKWGTESGMNGIGLIAQEVKEIFPFMVNEVNENLEPQDPKKTKLLEFNPSAMLYVLINAVKEIDQKITHLENQLKSKK